MSPATSHPDDRRWMEQALALAALAEGATAPNPRVGCVLVKHGRVVGRGYHRAAGMDHAEAVAVERAGPQARGATLYVNLEPCAHHGRTPPCCELLARSGVRRVVAALKDPNPLVDGRGFAALRAAGVDVSVGTLATDARGLNAGFLHWHGGKRPRVTVKAAVTLDGVLAAADGESRWITGEPARRFAHRLRLRHDALLVGAGTVRRDDPRLTVRLPGVEVTRRRAVIAPDLRLSPDAQILGSPGRDEPRTRIYVRADLPDEAGRELAGNADIVRIPHRGGVLDLGRVLDDLGELGVQSLLVEGGGRTVGRFVESGLAADAALFVAPRLLGTRGATPLLDLPAVATPDLGWSVRVDRRLRLGSDLLLMGPLRSATDATSATR